MIDIPRHIKRLRILTVEKLALVMAGLFDCDDLDMARDGNYTGWREAEIYRETIIQAIKLNEIKPFRVFLWDSNYSNELNDWVIGNTNKISINSNIVEAEFLASDAWVWAEKKLEEEIPTYITPPTSIILEKFKGKETALMIIAGLSIALGKSADSFKRGGKINQSEVIRAAEFAINAYGSGVNVTARAVRDWIRPALQQYASKLPE